MSRYPNRIPQRTPQAPKKEEKSALSYFLDTWNRTSAPRKVTTTCEDYIRNMSVRNRDYTIPTYRNTVNDFSKLLIDDNDEMKDIRLIDKDNKSYSEVFDKKNNNRLQRFSFNGKLYEYKSVLRVEKLENTEGYGRYKDIGINNFFNIYVKHPFNPSNEIVLAVLGFSKK